MLVRSLELANSQREDGVEPLPALSPHGLRRTFASWLIGAGEDVAYVMDQLGHTDPQMTLGLYAQALKSKRRRAGSQRAQTASDWALSGTTRPDAALEEAAAPAVLGRNPAWQAGSRWMGGPRFERGASCL